MFAVIYAVLCWGTLFKGSHIIFHVDNNAIFNAIQSKTIRSILVMKQIKHLIALACHLGFSFSSVWISSVDNAIADAASCFSFSHMFTLALWLNQKPTSKHLQLSSIIRTGTTLRLSHFTFGIDLQPAHTKLSQPDNASLYYMSNSTIFTMPMA